MKYDLIIFDFDGTLADTFPWFCSIINGVAEEYQFRNIAPSQLDEFRSLGTMEIIRRLEIPTRKLASITASVRALMASQIDRIELFPGIATALMELRARGIRIGIVSSNSHANIICVLGPELSKVVESFECGSSLFGKARRINQLLNQSNVPRERAIYIGDETRDAQAAQKVGVDFGGVSWGYNTLELISSRGPAIVFENVGQVVEKLTGPDQSGPD